MPQVFLRSILVNVLQKISAQYTENRASESLGQKTIASQDFPETALPIITDGGLPVTPLLENGLILPSEAFSVTFKTTNIERSYELNIKCIVASGDGIFEFEFDNLGRSVFLGAESAQSGIDREGKNPTSRAWTRFLVHVDFIAMCGTNEGSFHYISQKFVQLLIEERTTDANQRFEQNNKPS